MARTAIRPAPRRRSPPVALLHRLMRTRTVSSKLKTKSPLCRRSFDLGRASTRLASSLPSRLTHHRKAYQENIKSRAVSKSTFTNATSKLLQKRGLHSFCSLQSRSKPHLWWPLWLYDTGASIILKMEPTRGCSSIYCYMDYSLFLRVFLEWSRPSLCGSTVRWGVPSVCTIRYA